MYSQQLQTRLMSRAERLAVNNETEEHESMEERRGEAFADVEQLTVIGRRLQAGEAAPNFGLDYLRCDGYDRVYDSAG